MLPNNFKNGTKLYKAGLLALICFSINGCSSMDISYISRDEIKKVSFAQVMPKYIEKKPMSLGAIRLINKDAKEGEMGQILLLQKKKGVYMVETMVKDTGKKRYFFSLGVDYRKKTPAIGFRMEF